MSRVSCDLLVLGAKCETVVIFGLLEVVNHWFLTTLTHLWSKVDEPLLFFDNTDTLVFKS